MHELEHLLFNGAHWLFHLIADLVFGFILYPVVRWMIRRHDRKAHGHVKHKAVKGVRLVQELRGQGVPPRGALVEKLED